MAYGDHKKNEDHGDDGGGDDMNTVTTDQDLVWKPICIQHWDTVETVETFAETTGLSSGLSSSILDCHF